MKVFGAVFNQVEIVKWPLAKTVRFFSFRKKKYLWPSAIICELARIPKQPSRQFPQTFPWIFKAKRRRIGGLIGLNFQIKPGIGKCFYKIEEKGSLTDFAIGRLDWIRNQIIINQTRWRHLAALTTLNHFLRLLFFFFCCPKFLLPVFALLTFSATANRCLIRQQRAKARHFDSIGSSIQGRHRLCCSINNCVPS